MIHYLKSLFTRTIFWLVLKKKKKKIFTLFYCLSLFETPKDRPPSPPKKIITKYFNELCKKCYVNLF